MTIQELKMAQDLIKYLKSCKPQLTTQQYKTLKGQILAGDTAGATKGLQKILLRQGSNAMSNN